MLMNPFGYVFCVLFVCAKFHLASSSCFMNLLCVYMNCGHVHKSDLDEPFCLSLSLSFFKEILLASSSYFMNLCIFMNWLFVQIRSLWTLLPLLFHIFVLVKMLIQALSFMDLYLLFVAHFIIFCHINLLESSISLCRFLNLIGKIFFWIFH